MQVNRIIDRILRVNHAGECAAVQVYRGQLRGLGDDLEKKKLVSEMMKSEQAHLQFFRSEIINLKTRPSLLLATWKSLAFGLGYLSARAGVPTAMACTVAIEEVIDEHYQKQIRLLEKISLSDTRLLKKIVQFRQDELDHRNIAMENEARKAPCYVAITGITKFCCRVGIFVAKRI
ncbi:ubiquinone biosynthesis COQ7 family protein [Neorickettsia helminthoeca str. Oregon]|uniref:Ubiquinone biosynthesis COQ7 family protein n=1 Tax=Neorickettsia helminthoeca str. Oregon TaxID=1286528 RepID=X5HJK9_9RICK|nr:demethoxyubiquinone hydroxylase family protein [Neorickettsia helminthoeca]AHX11279.1 ubiquinone biosynthesis COQ7 family protein [Neorickettsia helminthoeca str. Oregon]